MVFAWMRDYTAGRLHKVIYLPFMSNMKEKLIIFVFTALLIAVLESHFAVLSLSKKNDR